MVVLTGACVATVLTGGAPAIAGSALGATIGGGAATAGAGVGAMGTAVGVATSTGAIAGAGVAGTAAGAGIGAVAGGTAAAGVGGSGLGLGALVAGSGPVGWLAVGASESEDGSCVTYDCWKPVVHDTSEEPSNGMLLKDLICHPSISDVTIRDDPIIGLPNIILENNWSETFQIQYLRLHETGRIVCHALPVHTHC